jgi:glycosyltransferase involved in cell wall biosynthesis
LKILVCSLEAPLPPPNGLRLQVGALVKALRREHDVRVLALKASDQSLSSEPGGMRLVDGKTSWRAWWDLRMGLPPGTSESAKSLRAPLADELADFDPEVVHVTSGRLAMLGDWMEGRPTVLAALDAWHLNVQAQAEAATGANRWARKLEGKLVRRFERSRYPRFDRVVVVSDEDREALLGVQPSLSIEVIRNGVDAQAFDSDGTVRDPNLILFTGVMNYAPNVTAADFLARRVLPRVRETIAEARLALVGRDPPLDVRVLGTLPGIEVVGEVPDMRPWLSRAGVYACPMQSGTGIKNKLLEAMANGLPCVATRLALQGLSATSGEHVLVGDHETELAGHLGRVIQDRGLAERIGAAGRAFVRAHHTWESVAAEYVRVYRQVVTRA